MSGIVGIWNLDGRPVDRALLGKLSEKLAHRGPDGERLWVQGPVGLACQLFRVTPEASGETQPLCHSSGAVLVFDGRLDNREELLPQLPASAGLSAVAPDSALVLAAYVTFGDRFVERLNGDFALGLFDPGLRRLLLARDAVGVRPLYYYRTLDLFLFASEIKALLAHQDVSPRPNDDMLAAFLLCGGPPGEGMTCFEGVSSLPPAHVAVLTWERFVTSRYWDFDPRRRIRLRSFQDYAEAFRHHFELAVRRRLRSASPVAVSVSGGLDSSSIFCLAETVRRRTPGLHPPVLGVSYTSSDGSASDERAFLLEIEREYGIAAERVPNQMGLMNGARQGISHVEAPFWDGQWNTTQTFFRTVHRLGARVLLTGHWGDQMLFGQAYLIDLVHHLAWGKVWKHLNEFGRWWTDADPRHFRKRFLRDLVRTHVPDVLVPLLRGVRTKVVPATWDRAWFTEAFRKRARRLASQQTAVGRAFRTAHARSLYELARSTHHILCMEWNNKVASMHGLEMAFPFLDRDLISFLMGIPGEMQTWKGVPKALLREAMRGVLPDAIVQRRWKADFTRLVNEGIESDYLQVARCLQAEGMAVKFGYLKGEALNEELPRLRKLISVSGPHCVIAWSLMDLLALELWLQVFFGENNGGREGLGSPVGRQKVAVSGGTA